MDNYEQGINTLNELLSEERANAIRQRFMELSPTFETEAVSVVFGRTWSRDTLDAKTRAVQHRHTCFPRTAGCAEDRL